MAPPKRARTTRGALKRILIVEAGKLKQIAEEAVCGGWTGRLCLSGEKIRVDLTGRKAALYSFQEAMILPQ